MRKFIAYTVMLPLWSIIFIIFSLFFLPFTLYHIYRILRIVFVEIQKELSMEKRYELEDELKSSGIACMMPLLLLNDLTTNFIKTGKIEFD